MMPIDNEIENCSSESAENHVRPLEHYIKECGNLDIDEIILRACEKNSKIELGRKYAYLDSRVISQNAQELANQDKVSTYKQKNGLYCQTAAVVFHVASAIFGGQASQVGAAFSALAQAFTTMGDYQEKLLKAREEALSHSYNRQGSIERDCSAQVQSSDREYDAYRGIADRIIANERRLTEVMVGGS
jgi:hypothetical protein